MARSMRVVLLVVLLTGPAGLAACGQDPDADCSGRIRFEGTIYRPHNELNQKAPTGGVLGTGEIIGCGGIDDANKVDTVQVHAVEGVDNKVAVATTDSDWFGVYIAEGMPRASWPAPLEK